MEGRTDQPSILLTLTIAGVCSANNCPPPQVIVMQAYRNNSSVAIEAKYVFPLDDMATVCGFEAFINGKHVIGQVSFSSPATTPTNHVENI